jgi:predicted Zn-dependent protease
LQAAAVAADMHETNLASQYLEVAFTQNPAWSEVEIGNGRYAALGRSPLFQRWVTNDERQQARKEYQEERRSGNLTAEKSLEIATKLLEIGLPEEALTILSPLAEEHSDNPNVHSLLAEAHAGRNDFDQAEKECQAAIRLKPDDYRLRAQFLHLLTERSH